MTKEELYYLPASELLKHIQVEKERLIKEKIIKKQKKLTPITEEEIPYKLPEDWTWVRLGDVVDINLGLTHKPEYIENGIPFISVKDISKGNLDFSNCQFISQEKFESMGKGCKPQKGDILFGRVGTLGKPIIVDVDFPFAIFVSLGYLRPYIINSNKYIKYLLESSLFYDQIKANVSGAVQVNLNTGWLSNFIFPLPPLYVQDQIVQKLEQLSKIKDSLLSHAESQLNYTKKMREALLQEAICGELVPQDENEEPASVLLEKIKTEKERLIKEKIIKKQKKLTPITEEEKPYKLPVGWEWVRLEDIVDINLGLTHKPEYIESGIPFISVKDISKGILDFSNCQFISHEKFESMGKGCKPQKGDILFGRVGTLGKPIIVDVDFPFAIFVSLGYLRPYIVKSNKYIKYLLESNLFYDQIKANVSGAVQVNLNTGWLSKFIFPLPPLAEQERIVAKLDELMSNCDQLESKAEKMKNYTTKLFEASLKEAFMPE